MPFDRPTPRAVVLATLAACLLGSLLVPLSAAAAGKTTICHRTSSLTNPYRKITVSQNALAKQSGHKGHTAGVWHTGLTSATPKWGDVVPDASEGGSAQVAQNWTVDGQAVWRGATRTAKGAACGRMSALRFVEVQRAAGVSDADIVTDLNTQDANEDAALLASLGGAFTLTNLSSLGTVTATTLPATSVTSGTATLHGSVAVATATAKVTFVYGTDPWLGSGTTTAPATPATVTGTGPVSLAVSGLASAQRYYYRVVATTAQGTDAEGVLEGEVLDVRTTGTTDQAIAFPALPALVVGEPAVLEAPTSTSGLPVALTSTSPTVCAVSGTTVTPRSAGTCTLAADQPGDTTYAPAIRVLATTPVTASASGQRSAQAIVFESEATRPAGTTSVLLSARADSGLDVTLTVDSASGSTCTVSGRVLSFARPGTCTVHADQEGDAAWAPATRVTRTVSVSAPAPQTIAFDPQRTHPAGTTSVALSATATSGLPVSFRVDPASAALCSTSGSTLSFAGPGSCTVSAEQPGSSAHLPAAPVPVTVTVAADQVAQPPVETPPVETPPVETPPVETPPVQPTPTPTPRPDLPAPPLERVQGRERTETAAQLAEQLYPQPRTAKVVVLARSDVYADGLTGSPLAGTLDGPVLLTEPEQLSATTSAALRRVLETDGTVYVLGGPRAVSPGVAAEVRRLGYRVTRIGGVDRYDTATLIADRIGAATDVSRVYLATGIDFPDALAAASAAEVTGGVVLLTRGARMPTVTDAWLDEHDDRPLTAVGGAASAAAPRATRIVGADRYSTAAQVAQAVLPEADGVVMVTGTDFPDGLAGASYAARHDWPMLLVDPRATSLTPGQDEYLGQLRGGVKDLVAIGGPAALPPAATSLVSSRLDRPAVR